MTKREVYGSFHRLCRRLHSLGYRVEYEGGLESDQERYAAATAESLLAANYLVKYEETRDRADLQAAAQQIGFAWDALGVPVGERGA